MIFLFLFVCHHIYRMSLCSLGWFYLKRDRPDEMSHPKKHHYVIGVLRHDIHNGPIIKPMGCGATAVTCRGGATTFLIVLSICIFVWLFSIFYCSIAVIITCAICFRTSGTLIFCANVRRTFGGGQS